MTTRTADLLPTEGIKSAQHYYGLWPYKQIFMARDEHGRYAAGPQDTVLGVTTLSHTVTHTNHDVTFPCVENNAPMVSPPNRLTNNNILEPLGFRISGNSQTVCVLPNILDAAKWTFLCGLIF